MDGSEALSETLGDVDGVSVVVDTDGEALALGDEDTDLLALGFTDGEVDRLVLGRALGVVLVEVPVVGSLEVSVAGSDDSTVVGDRDGSTVGERVDSSLGSSSSVGSSLGSASVGGLTVTPSPQFSSLPSAGLSAPPTVTAPDETATAPGSTEYHARPPLMTSPWPRSTVRARPR
jgi:hypothetical protein